MSKHAPGNPQVEKFSSQRHGRCSGQLLLCKSARWEVQIKARCILWGRICEYGAGSDSNIDSPSRSNAANRPSLESGEEHVLAKETKDHELELNMPVSACSGFNVEINPSESGGPAAAVPDESPEFMRLQLIKTRHKFHVEEFGRVRYL